jgi:hypothetical protein
MIYFVDIDGITTNDIQILGLGHKNTCYDKEETWTYSTTKIPI